MMSSCKGARLLKAQLATTKQQLAVLKQSQKN